MCEDRTYNCFAGREPFDEAHVPRASFKSLGIRLCDVASRRLLRFSQRFGMDESVGQPLRLDGSTVILALRPAHQGLCSYQELPQIKGL